MSKKKRGSKYAAFGIGLCLASLNIGCSLVNQKVENTELPWNYVPYEQSIKEHEGKDHVAHMHQQDTIKSEKSKKNKQNSIKGTKEITYLTISSNDKERKKGVDVYQVSGIDMGYLPIQQEEPLSYHKKKALRRKERYDEYKTNQMRIVHKNIGKHYVRIREEKEVIDEDQKAQLQTLYWTLIGREGKYTDKGKKVQWLSQGVVERKDILPFVESASMESSDLTEIYEYPHSYKFLRYDKALEHYEKISKNNMRTIVSYVKNKSVEKKKAEFSLEEEQKTMNYLLRSTYYEPFVTGNIEKAKLAKLRYEGYERLAEHYLGKEDYKSAIQSYESMEDDLYDRNYLSVFSGMKQPGREKINRGLAKCYFLMRNGKARNEYCEALLERYYDVSQCGTLSNVKKQLEHYYQLLLRKEQISTEIHELNIKEEKQTYYVVTYKDEEESKFLSVVENKGNKLVHMDIYGSQFDDGEKVVLSLKRKEAPVFRQSSQNAYTFMVPYGENTYPQTRGDIMIMKKNEKWLYYVPDSEKQGDKPISEKDFKPIY